MILLTSLHLSERQADRQTERQTRKDRQREGDLSPGIGLHDWGAG